MGVLLLIGGLLIAGCVSTPAGRFTLISTEPLPELGTRLEAVEGDAGVTAQPHLQAAVDDALAKSGADTLEEVTVSWPAVGSVRVKGTPVKMRSRGQP